MICRQQLQCECFTISNVNWYACNDMASNYIHIQTNDSYDNFNSPISIEVCTTIIAK